MRRQFGKWNVGFNTADGARLESLSFGGTELLTAAPKDFRPPKQDLGRYELRPVYGYDDCLPTIIECDMPGEPGVRVPDHGELCWLPWKVADAPGGLEFRVDSGMMPGIGLTRRMTFGHDRLAWDFTIANGSDRPRRLLHVMHPLMPPAQIRAMRLPAFATAYDEVAKAVSSLGNPRQVERELLGLPRGKCHMLLLQKVAEGRVKLQWAGGLNMRISFPREMFPTLAIWWNRCGYPDEAGLGRDEFAMEPCPGSCSSLADAVAQGPVLDVPAGGKVSWRILWKIVA